LPNNLHRCFTTNQYVPPYQRHYKPSDRSSRAARKTHSNATVEGNSDEDSSGDEDIGDPTAMMAEILQVTDEMDYVNTTNKCILDELRTFMIYSDERYLSQKVDELSPSQCASSRGAVIDDVVATQSRVIGLDDRLGIGPTSQCASSRGAVIDAVYAKQERASGMNVASHRRVIVSDDRLDAMSTSQSRDTELGDSSDTQNSKATRKRSYEDDADTDMFGVSQHYNLNTLRQEMSMDDIASPTGKRHSNTTEPGIDQNVDQHTNARKTHMMLVAECLAENAKMQESNFLAELLISDIPGLNDQQKSEILSCIKAFHALASTTDKGENDIPIPEADKVASQMKEIRTIIEYDAIKPTHIKDLTQLEICKRVLTRIFTIRKRCGKIKSRAIAGAGARRQDPRDVGSTYSPTAKFRSMMLALKVALHEKRSISTVDMTGAYLHADLQDSKTPRGESFRRILEIKPDMVHLVLSIKPEWAPYVCNGVGRRDAHKGSMFFVIKKSFIWPTRKWTSMVRILCRYSEQPWF
jgi:hypothetical protein